MPPSVPRKRTAPEPPSAQPSTKRVAKGPKKVKRETVFDAIEATKPVARGEEQEKFLQGLDEDSQSSPLSDAESVDGTAVEAKASPFKRRKTNGAARSLEVANGFDGQQDESSGSEESDEEEDEEEHWDDYLAQHDETKAAPEGDEPVEDGNIEVTLEKAKEFRFSDIKASSNKKGPSKIERQIRNSTHQLHVMSLMYHNHMRNHWMNNKKMQDVLVKQLPEGCKDELERWRKACGNKLEPKVEQQHDSADGKHAPLSKGKGRPKTKAAKGAKSKNIRDWGPKAEEDETGQPNLSNGDPTLRLLKALSAFWRKRFNKTAPGLRKHGYKGIERLQEEMRGLRDDPNNQDDFGERVQSFGLLLELAKKADGSRDVGAQLFTALCRGIGLKARMVASLQPAGFGWSKGEEADPQKKQSKAATVAQVEAPAQSSAFKKTSAKPRKSTKEATPQKTQPKRQSSSRSKGKKDEPIDLSDEDDDSPLSEPPSSDTDESVIDVTTSRPLTQSHKRYDGDLHYPHYWTEVLSPVTNTFIPVDPICLSVVASGMDSHSVFEPRGAGADRNKQVLAYVVACNDDGSAKDVTTRYLKRHVWPGKTKGVRYPIEKVPIYNRKGKIIKHEQYDWWQDVMSCYQPPGGLHSVADKLEDSRELKPVHINRNAAEKPQQESLQYYKSSAHFVLKRHLRREEALLPTAQPVKHFTFGKGDKATTEPVFNRSEVVTCKSSESWHKEGREVKIGEQPLKRVPMRAVTATRKAEVEQQERETGVKAQQALFGRDQTDWIIPPPIEDGVIPKNAYGNMDVYVPTMIPEGAAHVPLRGTAKIAKKLEIDFAEACTGFEFGNRMAVPVLTGVVVAAENKRMLIDAWKEEEKIRKEKEKKKREKIALDMWRKMFRGLEIVERVRRDYGVVNDKKLHKEMDEAAKLRKGKGGRKGNTKEEAIDLSDDDIKHPTEPQAGFPEAVEDMGGGFLPEGVDVEIMDKKPVYKDEYDDMAGGFIIEGDNAANAIKSDTARSGPGKQMMSLREHAAHANESGMQLEKTYTAAKKLAEPNGIEWTASQEGVMEAKPTTVPSKKSGRPSAIQKDNAQKGPPKATTPAKRGRPKKRSPSPLTDGESLEASDDEASEVSDEEESDDYDDLPAKKQRSSKRASAASASVADGAGTRRRSGRLK